MAYEEKARPATKPHSLSLDERQRLSVSGVEEVVSFDDEAVSVRTVKGLLHVRGSGLKVEKLEKNTGELAITGLVTELVYEESGPASGFWAKLFR